MKKHFKITTFLVKVLSLYTIFGVAFMPITIGYYIDTETLLGNEHIASNLDFELKDGEDSDISEKLFDKEELIPGESVTETLVVDNDGDLYFHYEIEFTNFSGQVELCEALEVVVDQNGDEEIDDSFPNISNYTLTLESNEDELEIEVYLSDDDELLQDKSCRFDIEVFGWQLDSDGSWGFRDLEVITENEIESDWWIDPDVDVDSPNGGEVYTLGEIVPFEWDADSSDSSATAGMEIDIYLSTDGGSSYSTLIAEDIANTGSYNWTADILSSDLKIKVIGEDEHGLSDSDKSDNTFSVVEEEELPDV